MKVVCTAIVYNSDPEFTKLKAMLQSTLDLGTTDWVIAVDKKSVSGTDQFILGFCASNPSSSGRAVILRREWTDSFAEARNATLAELPEDTDWWYWLDSDDTIRTDGTLVTDFLATIPDSKDCVYFNYDYERDDFGNSTTTHTRGRFYRGRDWEWRGRVHEDCHRADSKDPSMVICQDEPYLWVHDTTGRTQDANERNVLLIKRELEDDPTAPRPWYYLGNHFFAKKDFAKAVAAYERYIGISNWDVEKWTALIYQAISYRCLGQLDKSIETDTKAMLLIPDYADSYFGIGEAYTRKQEWDKALRFGEMGMARVASGEGVPPPVMFVNINAYQFNPYMWMAVAFFNLGENEKALSAYEQAAKARPEPDLLRTIDHLKWSMARDRITRNGLDLAAGLMRRNEPLKAKAILLNLPAGTLDDNPNVQTALRAIDKRIGHLYDPVAYKNLYFQEEETATPEAAIASIERGWLPRMAWVARRLKEDRHPEPSVRRVLDIGIGNGSQSLYLAQHGIRVVGIDVDRRRVKDANWAAVRMGLLKTKMWSPPGADTEDTLEVPDISPESPVQFHLCSLGEIPQAVRDLGPFDAVIASELIEHVEDPKALLELCESVSPRILLTTPDGAYDGPQGENPGHVIAFSQRELTRLVMPRGRIVEMHKVAERPGSQSNILCEYIAGEQVTGEPVVIWCPNTGQEWTPESIHKGGIGGSETAVIRVAEELAKRGKRVTVYAECEGVYRGVRYARTEDFFPQPCALFVAWRTPGPTELMAGLADERWLWLHDIDCGDALTERVAKSLTSVLALTLWHKAHLLARYPFLDRDVSARVLSVGLGVELVTQTEQTFRESASNANLSGRGRNGQSGVKAFAKSGTGSLPLSSNASGESNTGVKDGEGVLESSLMLDAESTNDLVEATDRISAVDADLPLGLGRVGTTRDVLKGVTNLQLCECGRNPLDDFEVCRGDDQSNVGGSLADESLADEDAPLAVEVAADIVDAEHSPHASMVPHNRPLIQVIGNGIDPERFAKDTWRQRYRLIYAQSPDRGLDVLLDLFPKIRARYKGAELHVYYGFEMSRERNPQFIAQIEEKAKQPGVFLHGRVDQATLAEAYLQSDVLLYPALMPNGQPFDETYCISVVEAQAAGCVPITPDWGALAETNKMGIVVHDAEPQDLLDALFDFWQMPRKVQDEYRQMGHLWATGQTWTKVAVGWESREMVLA